jgi:hypothetical protein
MLNFKQSSLAILATIAVSCATTSAFGAVGTSPAASALDGMHSLGLRTASGALMVARRGADDAAGDDRGGRGRGADDAAGDDRGGRGRGRGADDGANHARRGADDAAGDDRGGRGRGRGAADGAGHA